MKRKTKKWILLAVLLVLVFIWGNSTLPATVSSRESEWVLELLSPLFDLLGRLGVTADPSFLVRKMAHFAEYMVLGVMMCLLFLRDDLTPRLYMTAMACAVAAGIDETIQKFSEGRGPGLRDVLLDFVGSMTGITLLSLGILLFLLRKKRE